MPNPTRSLNVAHANDLNDASGDAYLTPDWNRPSTQHAYDPLDSISVTTNTSQVVKGTLNYFPYGAIRVGSGDPKTDYAFTGQRLETTDGLFCYGARDYEATIGRFLQPDSLTQNLFNPQDLNRYSNTRNNPLRYTDPTGDAVCEDVNCELHESLDAGPDERTGGR